MTAERPRNVITALEDAAGTGLGFSFRGEGDPVELRYGDLLERARERAGALAAWGVEPGDTVGILGPNAPEWVEWAFASWARGATVVPIPFGMRIADLGEYVARLQRLVAAAGCRVVMADARFLPAFPEGMARAWDGPVPTLDPSAAVELRSQDAAVLQFTSGTTSEPKMAELAHGRVLACVDSFLEAFRMRPDDVSLSWLPLFHDNGLFGHMIGPVVARVPGWLIRTERFARNPAGWFTEIAEAGATMTSGPCSAWAIALKAALRGSERYDLSRLRMGIFGAEAIEPAALDGYGEHAAELGLAPGTLVGAYGLAEATLLVTVGAPGEGMRFDLVDSTALAERGEAVPVSEGTGPARRIASCGRPSPIFRVRIVGPDGALPDRRVGEIQVSGPGLMTGYRGLAPEEQPFTEDGWLRTGDAGYLAEGELYVTGRIKDLIIVLGRNYAPEEFEWEAQQVPGVRAGRCVAFAADGEGEGRAIVVFEPAPGIDPEETAAAVRRRVATTLGVAVGEVLPVAKGTVMKTTSGKLQRAALREAYARGEVARLDAGADPGS